MEPGVRLQKSRRWLAPLAALATAVLLLGAPAYAATITSVTGSASTSVTTQGGPEPADYYAEASFFEDCGVGCSAFTGRLGANAGIEADPGENIRIDVVWSYTIDITVDAGATEAWELTVDTELAGFLTTVNHGSGRTRQRHTDLTGTLDTAGLGLTGSMDLPGTDTLNTSASVNQPLSRTGSFSVTGGFGPQTVSMTFSLDGRLRSQCTGGGCATQGDEAAIRLGLPPTGAPPGFTAGNYPGIDGDPAAAHGHFLSFALVAVPEPSSLGLLLGALPALMALRGCRR
jgi:hypothetical protein